MPRDVSTRFEDGERRATGGCATRVEKSRTEKARDVGKKLNGDACFRLAAFSSICSIWEEGLAGWLVDRQSVA